jgi:Protein of unknown function (DUF2934)
METKQQSFFNYGGDMDLGEFREMIAVNAYYRGEKRGFEDCYEIDDWHEAEKEIISLYRYWFRDVL